MSEADTYTDKVREIVDRAGKVLAGHGSAVQGAALADLTAMWIAGHLIFEDAAETEKLTEKLLALHTNAVRTLIPVNAKIIRTILAKVTAKGHGNADEDPPTN